MNWSIEQNYILLQFIHCYGENEWSKRVTDLKDFFSIFLTTVHDIDINNFTEDDFRRQYNYILATTRQECQKQGLKIVKSSELTEIALKKFYNYLEQQHGREDYGLLQSDLKLMEEGRISHIDKDKLREMREKIYNIVGEDWIGTAFGLEKMEEKGDRDKCIKEMSESWIRRLSDGRICVAGDTDIFPEELLNRLYEESGFTVNDSNTETDSDATETLEESCDDEILIIPFEKAVRDAEITNMHNVIVKDSGFIKQFAGQKIIAGWNLNENGEENQELDEKLRVFEEEFSKTSPSISEFLNNNNMLSGILQMLSDRQNSNPVPYHYSPHSSASTQEALTTRLTVSVATESCEMTPGSQSVDTAISHATLDELDELPIKSNKETKHGRKKKRARQSGLSVKKTHESLNNGFNKDTDGKRKIMRNITKMVLDHPYSSILTRPLRPDTGIYNQPFLNITKISHDVNNGDFIDYEQFIETIILFFLQMKVYYLNDKETVKKIEAVYADVSKQLSIIHPDLNDTAPLSDLIQRRQSRFQGHYV